MQIILSPESISSLPGPDGSRTEGIFPRFSPRPGDSLHATVIFISDKAANLKLETGAIIRASIQGLSTLAEGDRVRFLVNESSGQRILLSPLEIQRPGFGKIFDTGLSASPLPVESLGQDIFQALARTGLSLNPELESRLTELITAYPRLEAELAVLLAANEIPLTAENVLLAELLQKSEIKTDGLHSRRPCKIRKGKLFQALPCLEGRLKAAFQISQPNRALPTLPRLDFLKPASPLPRPLRAKRPHQI